MNFPPLAEDWFKLHGMWTLDFFKPEQNLFFQSVIKSRNDCCYCSAHQTGLRSKQVTGGMQTIWTPEGCWKTWTYFRQCIFLIFQWWSALRNSGELQECGLQPTFLAADCCFLESLQHTAWVTWNAASFPVPKTTAWNVVWECQAKHPTAPLLYQLHLNTTSLAFLMFLLWCCFVFAFIFRPFFSRGKYFEESVVHTLVLTSQIFK